MMSEVKFETLLMTMTIGSDAPVRSPRKSLLARLSVIRDVDSSRSPQVSRVLRPALAHATSDTATSASASRETVRGVGFMAPYPPRRGSMVRWNTISRVARFEISTSRK